MLQTLKRTFARRSATLPIIGILAIAATACQGVGLTEARQAVDNQRAVNELEDREVRPIEREIETLYETQILPLERELEDLWNEIRDLENGELLKDEYNNHQDPWAPGGEAYVLQQEFNAKYTEIDRLYRELDVESRKIQIEQQFDNGHFGIDPAVQALEDERFALQRELDRLHQFGRRPIEDIYLQMNDLNASNGWSQSDIYEADDLNRQIADLQNQIDIAYSNGFHFNDHDQQELISIEQELNYLYGDALLPIQDLYNRIAELEASIGSFNADGTVTGGFDAAGNSIGSTVTDPEIAAKIAELRADMAAAADSLQAELADLEAQYAAISNDAQAQINDLLANGVVETTVEPVDTSALEADIALLQQEIASQEAAVASLIDSLLNEMGILINQIGDVQFETANTVANMQGLNADLQAQIDALDSTAADYADVKAGLEADMAANQATIDTATANESTQVSDLQAQVDAKQAEIDSQQAATDASVVDLQAQIDAKQAEIDAANADATGTTSTGISQEVLDQIASIEQARDNDLIITQAQIDTVRAQIDGVEAPYLAEIADLEAQGVGPGVAVVPVETDPNGVLFEIQTLRDQAAEQEKVLNEKIRVLEDRRDDLQASINGVAGGVDVAALENELALLHDKLNALHDSGVEASRNYNLMMEELQTKAVELEKQLSLDIRALEDKLWELDGRIAELYHSGNGSNFDPHAKYNERLKEIELERFELEQRRWDLDDEQNAAFNGLNDFGHEANAEAEAKRAALLDPLYARINEIEDELKELRLEQRDLEDQLRDARKRVEEEIRKLEDQTLEAIDDALTAAEEGAENLNSLGDGALGDLDPSLLEGLDPAVIEDGQIDPTGASAQ